MQDTRRWIRIRVRNSAIAHAKRERCDLYATIITLHQESDCVDGHHTRVREKF